MEERVSGRRESVEERVSGRRESVVVESQWKSYLLHSHHLTETSPSFSLMSSLLFVLLNHRPLGTR